VYLYHSFVLTRDQITSKCNIYHAIETEPSIVTYHRRCNQLCVR